ncbi:MAG: hypothetical protein LIO56_03815 [Lachnospiraceae bacterium]|nr:hypothetical protein [Lachnospiraceae bacterium]
MKGKRLNPFGDKDRGRILEQWPDMRFSEKCGYIWSYYKVYIIVAIIAVLFAIFLIRNILNHRSFEDFYVMVLDSPIYEEEDVNSLEISLSETLGLDPYSNLCLVETGYSSDDNNMESAATVSTYMKAGRVDLVIAPEEKFNTYASTGYLKALTDPEYESLIEGIDPDRLFYAEEVDYSEGGAVYDIPMHPHEQTADSDCYGIYLNDGEFDGMAIGIMINAPHENLVVPGMAFFLANY